MRRSFVALAVIASVAWTTRAEDVPPLSQFDVIQFISSDGFSPEPVMKLDDNGDIIRACITGKSKAELHAAGIPFTESQLVLLRIMRVVEVRGDKYYTAIPLIYGSQTEKLRDASRAFATALLPRIEPEARKLVAFLRSKNRDRNAYSIFFSYVIDGAVWDELDRMSAMRPVEITAKEPHWSGEVWGIHPARAAACGTNSNGRSGVNIVVNWSRPLLERMGPFLSHASIEQLQTAVLTGSPLTKEGVTTFAPFAITDDAGRLTMPIIDENDSDVLMTSSTAIARTIAAQAVQAFGSDAFAKRFGLRDRQQAVVVAYHEGMWDLLDLAVREGIIEVPPAFANPSAATPSDIGDLVFAVRHRAAR